LVHELIEALRRFKEDLSGKKLVRDEASRLPIAYEYVEQVSEKQVIADKLEVGEVKLEHRGKFSNIYALDSSSRAIDTPYLFMAVGSATCLNRFTGAVIDYPELTSTLTGRSRVYDYVVLIPEIEGVSESLFENLAAMKVRVSNPAGKPYTPRYSKYVVLDELRQALENKILEILLEKESYRDAVLLIDGPLYYTPPLVYQVNELHGVRDELLEEYVVSWKTLVKARVELLQKLYREKNVTAYGVVKRLNKSNILSRKNPMNLSSGNVSDEAYLAFMTEVLFGSRKPTPYYIGPLVYDPGSLGVDLPRKTIYYVGIPRRGAGISSGFSSYAFFRVELLEYVEASLEPVTFDSVGSGSILPLTLLLADSRVKRIATSLANYILRTLGLPSDTTRQYISL